MKGRFFQVLLAITAFTVAAAAAYFSVFGLSKLFAGAFSAVVIMASTLEVGKLITVSYLYRTWNKISKFWKVYWVLAVLVLMLITSGGIYGFLSNAYQITATGLESVNQQIEVLEQRKEILSQQIKIYSEQSITYDNRIRTLSDIRDKQETRLDSLYQKEYWISIRRTEESIKEANENINSLNIENKKLSESILFYSDSVGKINLTVAELQNSEFSADLGPLIYISKLTNRDMNKVVNWFILLLIFVFDPLAVSLIMAVNQMEIDIQKDKDRKNIKRKSHLKKYSETDNLLVDKKIEEDFGSIGLKEELEEKEKELKEVEDNNVQNLFNEYIIRKKKMRTKMDSKTSGIQYYEE